uniref:F-box domain-containing protein n=1 Tax=Strongyloides papillosus TaxID=174720 RepID=A0A0N5BV65_STREA
MEAEKNLTFLKLMEINLIRKSILARIKTFEDIQSLTKTCRLLNFYIQNDLIRKQILWIKDEQYVTIKVEDDFHGDSNMLYSNGIEFISKASNHDVLNGEINFNGEIVSSANCIFVQIKDATQNYRREKNELFFWNLAKEIKLNLKGRKNATTIDFTGSFSNNSSTILNALCYMEHENIRKIKVPKNIFMSDYNGYDILSCDVFKGFPNLCELAIFGNINKNDFKRIVENKNVLEHVLKELSKKNNPRLVLTSTYNTYKTFIMYSHMFLNLAKKYGIEVSCNLINLLPLSDNKKSSFYSVERCSYFEPISKHISSIANNIINCRVFLNVMKNSQTLTNLEMLIISFRFFDIKKGLQRMDQLNCDALSLKHCKKLKRVVLYFEGYGEKKADLRVTTFHSNLKYLTSLMPDSVERFDLVNGFELTNEITETINKYMPKIKSFTTYEVSYKDSNCLEALKNLQEFISYESLNIVIPSTVKFLAILQRSSHDNYTVKPLSQELFKTYSSRFKKHLQSTKGDNIFFNDILQWDMYKRIILGSYY